MRERPNRHDWKSCDPKGSKGSNPFASAEIGNSFLNPKYGRREAPSVLGDQVAIFRFIAGEEASFPVKVMCEVLGVSRAGFYEWESRPLSTRAVCDQGLTLLIRDIHQGSRGTYGAPRIHASLAHKRVRCGRKRVARLMSAEGLQGVHRRKGFRTTRRDESAAPAPDLVDRNFHAPAPDVLWVTDITHVGRTRGSSSSPPCWMFSRDGSWVGRWPIT